MVSHQQPTWSAIIRLFVLALVLLLLVSCHEATPTPLPPPVPYDSLYQSYQQELQANPTRVEHIIKSKPIHVVEGPITSIQGEKVQFHIQRVALGKDRYVECVFPNEESVLGLNIGETITIAGRLDRVDHVVRLTGCVLFR